MQVATALRALAAQLTFVRRLDTRVVLRGTQQDITRTAPTAAPTANRHQPPPPRLRDERAPLLLPDADDADGALQPAAVHGEGEGASRVYEFLCPRSQKQYVAEPPAGLAVEWLLAVVTSRALGCPLTLPLQPLFTCPPERMGELQPVLLPGARSEGAWVTTSTCCCQRGDWLRSILWARVAGYSRLGTWQRAPAACVC